MGIRTKIFRGILGLLIIASMVVTPALAQDKPVVGLVMKSLANEFFKTMEEGARKFAAEDGSFELIPVGMNSETDIDTQVSAMENFISQKVDLIVLAPADSVIASGADVPGAKSRGWSWSSARRSQSHLSSQSQGSKSS